MMRPSRLATGGGVHAFGPPRGAAGHESEHQLVQTPLATQLRVKRDRDDVPLPHRHRVAIDVGQDTHLGAGLLYPRRADEDRVDGGGGRVRYPFDLEVGLERPQLAAERVTAGEDVQHAEMIAV